MIRATNNVTRKSQDGGLSAVASDDSQQTTRTRSHARGTRGSFLTKHQTIINFWLDSLLLVNFVALIWISVIVQFIFPPAESAAGYRLWGLTLSQFMNVQFSILVCFFFGIVLHLMMHWSWVCGVIGSRLMRNRDGTKALADDGQRTIFGVGLMIVLLNIMGIGIAIAAIAIQAPF